MEDPDLVSNHEPVSSFRFSFRIYVAARIVPRISVCVTSLDQLFIARHHLKYAGQIDRTGIVTRRDVSPASGIIATKHSEFKAGLRELEFTPSLTIEECQSTHGGQTSWTLMTTSWSQTKDHQLYQVHCQRRLS